MKTYIVTSGISLSSPNIGSVFGPFSSYKDAELFSQQIPRSTVISLIKPIWHSPSENYSNQLKLPWKWRSIVNPKAATFLERIGFNTNS